MNRRLTKWTVGIALASVVSLFVTAAVGGSHLWDPESGREIRALKHGSGIRCLPFSADGQTLASGSLDKTLRLWSMGGGN
jgi:WD40 repeat protein